MYLFLQRKRVDDKIKIDRDDVHRVKVHSQRAKTLEKTKLSVVFIAPFLSFFDLFPLRFSCRLVWIAL